MARYPSQCGEVALRALIRAEAGDKRLTRRDEGFILWLLRENFAHASTPLPTVTHLELMICEDCNLRCDYCFIQNKCPASMSKGTGEKAVDFLINYSGDEKHLGTLFFGGEPLLGFETIAHIVCYAEKRATEMGKRFHFSITTNGTLLTDRVLQFFKEHNVGILLSIDGDEKTHDKHRKTRGGKGSFSLIARNLDRIFSLFPDIEVRMTPHPDTVQDLLDNVRFLLGVGFKRFIIGPAHGIDWPAEAYEVYEQQMREVILLRQSMLEREEPFHLINFERGPIICSFGCRAASKYMAVAANGDLAPCSMFLGTPGIEEAYKFGNVYEGLCSEIARRELLMLNVQRDRQCRSCELVPFCSGGCDLGIPSLFITHWFLEPEHFLMRMLESANEILFIEREDIFECPTYLADKVRYVGPVLRSFSYRKEDREQARRELGINPETKVVLVVSGAGWPEAIVPTFDLVFPAFEQMPFSNKLLLWLAGEDEASLRSKVDGRRDIVIKGTDWQIDRLMVASDLALTKSSYTTMCELDTLGIPSIALLHGHNPIDEIYAKRFPTVVSLDLRTLNPDALSQTMESLLRTPPIFPSACSPERHDLPSGAVQAAQAVVQFLSQVSHSSARSAI